MALSTLHGVVGQRPKLFRVLFMIATLGRELKDMKGWQVGYTRFIGMVLMLFGITVWVLALFVPAALA